MLNYEVVEILKDLSPSNSIVALDLETTGLDINKDRIIEIGATKLNLDTGEFESYSQLIDPITEISEFITDLTGRRPEDLKGKPIIDEITDDFQEFLKDNKEKQASVLQSPVCASLDQWKDFEERGYAFKKTVKELMK